MKLNILKIILLALLIGIILEGRTVVYVAGRRILIYPSVVVFVMIVLTVILMVVEVYQMYKKYKESKVVIMHEPPHITYPRYINTSTYFPPYTNQGQR